ncbi:hypothetical protein MNBD_GAMMA26-1695 [hydrothermal vent metagenome]|uniref:Cytochrome c domain-containing protein n=1 Tax=hydrothermal vent metagenome TaxID=652676 RepID=A0A3B1AWB0_9ZZZZ
MTLFRLDTNLTMTFGVMLTVLAALSFLPVLVLADSLEPKPHPTKRLLAQGEHQYSMRCARCHGEKGDGNGPVADFLDPRPRDFTLGMFKFRTTVTGALPTDEDLFRIITRGIPGTEMPGWEGLPEQLRWALLYYIKTFAEDFADPELDPNKFVITLSPKVPSSPASIAKGKVLYEENKCWECHGKELRGDGRTNLKNDWGDQTRVPNLRYGWNYRGGRMPEDIVYSFIAGLNGTAMPSYEDSIKDEDRWHLANYMASITDSEFDQQMILKVEQTDKPLMLDADAAVWRSVESTHILMQGQTMVEPLWINNAVDMLEVKALYNQDDIGFLIEWDDPVQDVAHHKEREVTQFQDQYVKVTGEAEIPREPGVFRDAIALRFPVNSRMDHKMPSFLGRPDNPLHLWIWKSDLVTKQGFAVEEGNSWGLRMPIQVQPDAGHQVRSKASWLDGRWRLVMLRSLTTQDKSDVQFAPDRIIPIAFNAWDGSNGEYGLIMGLTSWHLLYLEAPGTDRFDRMDRMLWFFGVSSARSR